jgi:hypothetical protein
MVWRRGGVDAGEADESGADLAAVGEFVEFPAVSSTATTSISLTKAPGRTSTRLRRLGKPYPRPADRFVVLGAVIVSDSHRQIRPASAWPPQMSTTGSPS